MAVWKKVNSDVSVDVIVENNENCGFWKREGWEDDFGREGRGENEKQN